MVSENKSVAAAIVHTEKAAAGTWCWEPGWPRRPSGRSLRAGAPGEPPGGAGALALVELDSEEVFKADIDSPAHSGPVELESENKSVTTAILQTETTAAGDLVLGAGVAQETGESPGEPPGEPPGGAGALESVELQSADNLATTAPPGEPPGSPPGESLGEPPGGAGALESAELESEDKFSTTAIVKAETATAGDLVLGAGVA